MPYRDLLLNDCQSNVHVNWNGFQLVLILEWSYFQEGLKMYVYPDVTSQCSVTHTLSVHLHWLILGICISKLRGWRFDHFRSLYWCMLYRFPLHFFCSDTISCPADFRQLEYVHRCTYRLNNSICSYMSFLFEV